MNIMQDFQSNWLPILERHLTKFFQQNDIPLKLQEVLTYSLKSGGKRFRPFLIYATLSAFNGNITAGLDFACALEFIHTYSLMHDDLPCMDDDDLRRGKPTSHIVFGEALAVLGGDALQPAAFQIIAQSERISESQKLQLIYELSKSSGASGMVGGQVYDILQSENPPKSIDDLLLVHTLKTGKLIECAIKGGAILANVEKKERKILQNYASHLGIAFQIKDDILDVEGSETELGKTVGSDASQNKHTYTSFLTLNGAKEELQIHANLALKEVENLKCDQNIFQEIIAMVVNRKK